MRIRAAILLVPTLLFVAACESTDQAVETETVTVTVSATPDAEVEPAEAAAATTTAPPVTQAPTTAPPAAKSWIMPNLVGANLQVAQDSIQALTDYQIFYTTSHDASGAGRAQVADSNWVVCSQTPSPGTSIDASTPIDFGAVKIGEGC